MGTCVRRALRVDPSVLARKLSGDRPRLREVGLASDFHRGRSRLLSCNCSGAASRIRKARGTYSSSSVIKRRAPHRDRVLLVFLSLRLLSVTPENCATLSYSEMESERAHHTATGHQIILPVTEFAFGYRVAAIAQIGGVYTQFPLRGAIARAQADGGKAVRRRGVALVQKPGSGVINIDAAQKPAFRRV